ncbi:MAG: cbb3-type cytochrome oxidase assembly protein CcoS [Polyangiaceae bacterium]|nr:cbb3-type cytochrome oxidase assembly protein CcoS [Polyangiaceae bacterium]
MDVGILLFFVSSVLAGCSVAAFVWTMRGDEFDHADRQALAPLAGEDER